jgi:sensor domain CHASE-containing protein
MAQSKNSDHDQSACLTIDSSAAPDVVESTLWLSLVSGLLALGLVLAVVWLLDRNSNTQYLDEVRAGIVRDLATVRGAAEIALNKRVHLTRGLKAYVSINPEITPEEFADLSALLMKEAAGIRSVTLIRDNVINDVYPRKGNEGAIGLELLKHPDQKTAALHAIETGLPWLGGPFKLVQGGEAFINRAPVYITVPGGEPGGGRYWGMVSIVIDKQTIVDEIMAAVPPNLSIAVRGRTDLGGPGDIFSG